MSTLSKGHFRILRLHLLSLELQTRLGRVDGECGGLGHTRRHAPEDERLEIIGDGRGGGGAAVGRARHHMEEGVRGG